MKPEWEAAKREAKEHGDNHGTHKDDGDILAGYVQKLHDNIENAADQTENGRVIAALETITENAKDMFERGWPVDAVIASVASALRNQKLIKHGAK